MLAKRIGVLVVLSASLILSGGLAASGEEPSTFIVHGSGSPSEAMLKADVAGIAEATGLSEKEVREAYTEQNAFNLAITDVRLVEPETYFSAGWEPGSGYDAWVSFTATPSQASIERLGELAIDVEVRTAAPASEAALNGLLEGLVNEVAATEGVAAVTGGWDAHDGAIDIAYTPEDAEQAIQLPALRGPVPVTFTPSADLGIEPEVVRGGREVGGCTSGFALLQGGIVTAGHCANSSYSMVGSAYPLPYVSEHRTSYGDFQRHSSVDSTSNQIRISSSGTLRAMTSIAYASVGSAVCNYGKTRASASCATVTDISECATWEGSTSCQLAVTNGTFTNPGDSGGPWYYNNTAFGIHYGKVGGYSSYSRTDNAQSILGVTIKLW
jgi:hypothetical protein